MTNILRLSVVLAIVTIIAGFVLSEIYGVTKPIIDEQKKLKTRSAVQFVMPTAKEIIPIKRMVPIKDSKGNVLYEKPVVDYYEGYADAEKTKLIGYAFKALGPGYSSVLETVVGVEPFGKIGKIKIISQQETPGLGANCLDDQPFDGKKWSTEQFVGKVANDLKVDKDGGEIITITGSTITTRAITYSIKDKLNSLMQKIDSTSIN